MGRPVSPKPGLRGPLACFYSEATGNKPHPSQFSVRFHFHHIRELQKSTAETTPNYLLPKRQWARCLRAGHTLLLGTHLGEGSSDSTFASSKPLYVRARLWSCNYCLLPFPVMDFQETNLFICASVRPKFMMVHKRALLFNDTSSLLGCRASCGERLLSHCAGILFPLHKWVPGHQLNCAWHRPLSTICWIETMQFTFLQKRTLTKAKMLKAIKHISIH